jgi:hypothetical protein
MTEQKTATDLGAQPGPLVEPGPRLTAEQVSTASRVCSETPGLPFKTRDTVASLTCA